VSEPRLVVFDIGGTLVTGPDRGPARRIAELADLTDDQCRSLHAALMTEPFETPAAAADYTRATLDADAAAAVEEVWRAQLTEAEPIPGALRELEELVERGTRIALLSNIWRPYLESARRHFGDFFDAHVPEPLQVFSFRAGLAKPDPRLFTRVLETAGVDAAGAVMVGDSYEKDIAPAHALGMRTRHVAAARA
jgi:HAD superfamily hydrolase (TIGR01509 family)